MEGNISLDRGVKEVMITSIETLSTVWINVNTRRQTLTDFKLIMSKLIISEVTVSRSVSDNH